ncbi:hypothetical protein EMPG_17695 [Blastomyces silverae]|uniref:Uncharacterized protein n=1 Tax=Blastomyces silverae TaxID=2060906 RepID=A0A0H1B701_9EURO|nr:hypothetical protein EMPG_17695 [Blastomyces silverae]
MNLSLPLDIQKKCILPAVQVDTMKMKRQWITTIPLSLLIDRITHILPILSHSKSTATTVDHAAELLIPDLLSPHH